MDRYHRQMLLLQVGAAGQARLASSRVAVLGCGALGSVSAELLTRAGVGSIVLIDRDIVQLTNLQRQTLYDEADARDATPKALAAAARLRRVNSAIVIEPVIADVHSGNIDSMMQSGGAIDCVIDGADSGELRYLLNDWCVREEVPWIYGAAVGVAGRVMPILRRRVLHGVEVPESLRTPVRSPCLRCVFENPPAAGELPTCDTAGVLGPLTAIIGAMQAAAAIALLVGDAPPATLTTIDAWPLRVRSVDVSSSRREDCPACGLRRFDFLNAPPALSPTLCGQDAVQISPANGAAIDLPSLAERWRAAGDVTLTAFFVRLVLADRGVQVTVFRDGRAIVAGTRDVAVARGVYAGLVGV